MKVKVEQVVDAKSGQLWKRKGTYKWRLTHVIHYPYARTLRFFLGFQEHGATLEAYLYK